MTTKKAQIYGGLILGLLFIFSDISRAVSPNMAKMLGSSIADAVEKAMPSVVVVRTEATRYRVARDWFWGQLYGIPEKLAGQGSGVIISKDGYILTNNHVIDDAEQIEVVLEDGTKYPAQLIGKDPYTDVAVIKIIAMNKEFPAITPGDSDELRVGEFVIAIGSPFSLSSSVTLGIVSQKGRAIDALPYEDFIQSDAAVNRGNSGGPLVDADGKMVGINTLIQTSGYSEGNVGISFAIPSNLAMTVAEGIIRKGKWERPWIGISMNQTPDGVVVGEVVHHSPAHRNRMESGDRLVAVQGKPVKSAREIQRAILRVAVGEKVLLKAIRGDREIEFEMVTEAMPMPVLRYGE